MQARRSLSPARSKRRNLLPWILTLGLVLGIALPAGFIFAPSIFDSEAGATEGCTATSTVRVSVSTHVAELARTLLQTPLEIPRGCVQAQVTPAEGAAIAQQIASGADAAALPQVWIPESSLWGSGGVAAGRLQQHGTFATSPLVLASSQASFNELKWAQNAPSWGTAASASNRAFAIADLLTSAESVGGLAAVRRSLGSGTQTDALITRLALKAYKGEVPTGKTVIATTATAGANAPLLAISEQRVLTYNRGKTSDRLAAIYPNDGSPILDYPILAMTGDSGSDAAVKAVVERMTSAEAKKEARKAGLRVADAEGTERLEGDVEIAGARAMDLKPEDLSAVLEQVKGLQKPARVVVAVDVSRTMDKPATGASGSRMDVTKAGLQQAWEDFPDQTQVELWSFTQAAGGAAHTSVAPMSPLSKVLPGNRSQRQLLVNSTEAFTKRVTPSASNFTDAVSEGVDTIRGSYDPAASNAVVVITDDAASDETTKQVAALIDSLRKNQKSDQSIPVHIIGVGPQSDAASFAKIAEATGGKSVVANDSRTVANALLQVLYGTHQN